MHAPLVAFAPDLGRLYPFRPMRRAILLIEKLTFHAIWITFHRERAVLHVRPKHRRDADVVVNYLRFGETGLRVKHLVQVRYLKLPIVDDEFRFLGHRSKPRTTSTKDAKVLVSSYSWDISARLANIDQAKKRSGESTGLVLQIRVTQCSQLSWPLKMSISTRRK